MSAEEFRSAILHENLLFRPGMHYKPIRAVRARLHEDPPAHGGSLEGESPIADDEPTEDLREGQHGTRAEDRAETRPEGQHETRLKAQHENAHKEGDER